MSVRGPVDVLGAEVEQLGHEGVKRLMLSWRSRKMVPTSVPASRLSISLLMAESSSTLFLQFGVHRHQFFVKGLELFFGGLHLFIGAIGSSSLEDWISSLVDRSSSLAASSSSMMAWLASLLAWSSCSRAWRWPRFFRRRRFPGLFPGGGRGWGPVLEHHQEQVGPHGGLQGLHREVNGLKALGLVELQARTGDRGLFLDGLAQQRGQLVAQALPGHLQQVVTGLADGRGQKPVGGALEMEDVVVVVD